MHLSIKRFNFKSISFRLCIHYLNRLRYLHKRILYLFLIASILTPAYSSSIQITNSAAPPSIVILGDSISAAYGVPTERGWVALLENKLKQEGKTYTVINASISGETTEGGVKRLPDIIDRHNPSILLIELGGNDGLRGFPLSLIKSNLQTLIDQAKSNNITPILIAMRIPPNYGRRYTSGFYNLFKETAEKNTVTLVPFLLEDVALKPELMQADGIHPTALAQPLLLDRVWETLEPLL
ncbi:arylesterase [Alkalimarinus alittae]|uniref:Arylesterase n=1 Tax=Alkalimarinus alittae TaxID=2961619 RepID=A0ABY6MYF5_9ALTE|nr:arylesterase [Alkalimarinus alittae]UZE94859.1 arylesterase [Alkalimarinus alittae]